MSLSIRWRLALWITAALVLTLAVVFLILNFALRQTLISDLDDRLLGGVNQISALLLIRGSLDSRSGVQDIVDRYSAGGLGSGMIVVVRDPEGNIVAATPGINPEDFAIKQDEVNRVLSGDRSTDNFDISGGEVVRMRTASISRGGLVLGIVQVGESTDFVTRSLDRLRILFVVAGSAAVVSTLAVAHWLSRRALRPIENVAAVAARIEASDLSQRIDAKREPAEVQQLSDTFDAMLQRLDRAFQQQRDFVLDVAHELRTPLTALRGNIDVSLMAENLEPQTRTQLERMSAEVGRLIRLASNLLYLALADARQPLDRRPVELDELALEVHRLARDLRPGVKLILGNEDQISVFGDRDLLKQLILNLVENGMKYTSPGGRVKLSMFRQEGEARIVVEDTGRGIPPEALPHIFERFYRADGHAKGGSGLGLAIAQWIALSHGGQIAVESEIGRGSTFTVTLPLADHGAMPSRPSRVKTGRA